MVEDFFRNLQTYEDQARRLGLIGSCVFADLYFESGFSNFPVGEFITTLRTFFESYRKRKKVSEGIEAIKTLIASTYLKERGEILSDAKLEELVEDLRNRPEEYATVMSIARTISSEENEKEYGFTPDRVPKKSGIDILTLYYHMLLNFFSLLNLVSPDLADSYNSSVMGFSLIRLPSIEKIIKGNELSVTEVQKNCEYIKEVRNFVKDNESFFTEVEKNVKSIVEEEGLVSHSFPPDISDWDKSMLENFYETGKAILSGEIDWKKIQTFLYQDKIRRGKIFIITEDGLLHYSPRKIGFPDVVGPTYKKNIEVMRRVLSQMEKRRSLGYFIILQGPPGTGKTYLMIATLNELPENANGIILEPRITSFYSSFAESMKAFKDIVHLHPDRMFIGFVDDIDLFLHKRGEERNVMEEEILIEFLRQDSITERGKLPTNCVIVASTNRPYVIDPAIIGRVGRIRYICNFPEPNKEDIKELATYYSKKFGIKFEPSIFEGITGLTCDDIHYMFREASERGLEELDKQTFREILNDVKERKRLIGKAIEEFGKEMYYV